MLQVLRLRSTLVIRPFSSSTVFTSHEKDNNVAVLTLNRLDRKNALSRDFALAIQEQIRQVSKLDEVRALVVRSLVPGIFCAGADLKERLGMKNEEVAPMSGLLRKTFHELSKLKFPTIAAIDGHALGGGLELALACDIRVAAANIKLGLVETNLGIIPGAGGTQRLPRVIGIARAKELIFTAKILSGHDAAEIDLVNQSVAQNNTGDAAFQESMAIAKVIASRGPIGIRAAKQAIDEGIEFSMEEGLSLEGDCYNLVVPTEDRIEGLKSFVEKRPPNFKGC